jgi:hypothetical protein
MCACVKAVCARHAFMCACMKNTQCVKLREPGRPVVTGSSAASRRRLCMFDKECVWKTGRARCVFMCSMCCAWIETSMHVLRLRVHMLCRTMWACRSETGYALCVFMCACMKNRISRLVFICACTTTKICCGLFIYWLVYACMGPQSSMRSSCIRVCMHETSVSV